MRSLVSEAESSVGLLLFDEPSTSLNLRAEHGMFSLFGARRFAHPHPRTSDLFE